MVALPATDDLDVDSFMDWVSLRNPGEIKFIQAVREVAEKVIPFLAKRPEYRRARILHRLTEPDRIVSFRVCWQDDKGQVQINRGYRVQFNNAIGPYKGGLRFHPSVNLSTLKFLGFEQIFKNSLTTLPMGGGKGGSDFDPKGRSDDEVMRFCQSLMSELYRYIGQDTDVPAGDIGVGAREIGFLFGQYRRIQRESSGVMTGKGLAYGGSPIRTEATGYGCVYFAREMMSHNHETPEEKTCVVSGTGNVAQYAVEKLIHLGAKVVTMSDSSGFVYDPAGFDQEKLDFVKELKNERRGRIKEYVDHFDASYHEGERPWKIPCDLAFPCATENELGTEDAKALIAGGCKYVCEGANMPVTHDAGELFEQAGVFRAPGKAANAGGVAISGLEMTQNAIRLTWTREEVDKKLQEIISSIHQKCYEYGFEDGRADYVRGANVAGFVKVADAMLAYGIV